MQAERPRRLARLATWLVAGLASIAVALFAVAALRQGPVTVVRMLAHGDTTIDDHRLYPFRPLAPSPQPRRFEPALPADAARFIRLTVAGAGEVNLDRWLEQTASIALVVLQDDRLLLDRYLRGRDATQISQAFSASKSVLSMLVGAALDDGLLRSVDDAVSDYVPELRERGFDRVRLVDLLTMNSGVDYVEDDNPLGQHVRFNYTPHLREEILALKVKPQRDPQFTYKSGDTALLALVLERALARGSPNGTARTLTQYTQQRLWTPLGMEHAGLWSLDGDDARGGMEKTWCCLSATARDFARLGALYRDGGRVRGRQLLPEQWVRDSTLSGPYGDAGPQWPRAAWTAGFWNYGYQWWLADRARGDYAARGKDGQFIYVDPGRSVVVVRLGYGMGVYEGRALEAGDWIALFQAIADVAGRT